MAKWKVSLANAVGITFLCLAFLEFVLGFAWVAFTHSILLGVLLWVGLGLLLFGLAIAAISTTPPADNC